VFSAGETLLLVIEDRPEPLGADFDQRDAGVADAAETDARQIDRLARERRRWSSPRVACAKALPEAYTPLFS
jgi:hypothetical protein